MDLSLLKGEILNLVYKYDIKSDDEERIKNSLFRNMTIDVQKLFDKYKLDMTEVQKLYLYNNTVSSRIMSMRPRPLYMVERGATDEDRKKAFDGVPVMEFPQIKEAATLVSRPSVGVGVVSPVGMGGVVSPVGPLGVGMGVVSPVGPVGVGMGGVVSPVGMVGGGDEEMYKLKYLRYKKKYNELKKLL